MTVVGHAQDIGWNAQLAVWWGADGKRAIILCIGYHSESTKDSLPTELVSVDTADGRVIGRLQLKGAFKGWRVSKDTAVILLARDDSAEQPRVAGATLAIVAFDGPQILSSIELSGSPTGISLSATREVAYVLEKGTRSDKPGASQNGQLQVVSLANPRVLATWHLGFAARDLVLDARRDLAFILSDGDPGPSNQGPTGQLDAFHGGEHLGPVPVAGNPQFLRSLPDRDRLLVAGPDRVSILKYPSLQPDGEIPLDSAGSSASGLWIFDRSHFLTDFKSATDGKMAFVQYEKSSKVTVLDLEARTVVADVTTGRTGVKVGQLASFLLIPVPTVLPPSAAGIAMLIGSDGRQAYVLNTQTGDVTAIDANTGSVLWQTGVPMERNRIQLMNGGQVLSVVGGSSLSLIDLKTGHKLPEVKVDTSAALVIAPTNDHYGVFFGDRVLAFVDGTSGKELRRLSEFKKIMQVAFAIPTKIDETLPPPEIDVERVEVSGR